VDFGMAEQKIPGDGVVTGYKTINGPSSSARFHGLRWLAFRDACREDRQGHGPGDEGCRASDCPPRPWETEPWRRIEQCCGPRRQAEHWRIVAAAERA
jgi:hypothetical protein